MSNMLTAFQSLDALGTAPGSSLDATSRVLVLPGEESTGLSNGYVSLGDFKGFVLTEIQAQVDALEAGGGGGLWPTPRAVTLTGLVTGSATMDGSADASITTSIADGALSMAKTSGLSAALLALQDDIDGATFDHTVDLTLANGTNVPPAFGMAANDGSKVAFLFNGTKMIVRHTATGGTPSTNVLSTSLAGSEFLTPLALIDTVTVNGDPAGPNAGKQAIYTALGQINLNGTGLKTLFHTGNLNPANFLTNVNALGNPQFSADVNATQPGVLGYWNATTTNITGLDNFGTILNVNANNGTNLFSNELCMGTSGTLVWRRRIDAGAWTSAALWHSGNFNPDLYLKQNTAVNLVQINLVKDSTGATDGGSGFIAYRPDGGIGLIASKSGSVASYALTPTGLVTAVPIQAGTFNVLNKTGLLFGGGHANDTIDGGIYISAAGGVTFGNAGGEGLSIFSDGSGVIDALSVTTSFQVANVSHLSADELRLEVGSAYALAFCASGALDLGSAGAYLSYSEGSDGKNYHRNMYDNGGGGHVFEIYDATGVKKGTPLNMGPTTTTAAGAWTFSSSLSVSGGAITVNPTGEGHLVMGNTDVYRYANATSIGAFGGTFGNAYNYTFSTKVFNIVGTQTTTSDERLKEGFTVMEAQPLWREFPLQSWYWIKDGIPGWGPNAQDVQRAAARYVHEDKEMPIAEMMGAPDYEVKKALKRIADGEEVGTLTVDKTGLTMEMVYAAGHLLDKLIDEVAQLRSQVIALSTAKASKK